MRTFGSDFIFMMVFRFFKTLVLRTAFHKDVTGWCLKRSAVKTCLAKACFKKEKNVDRFRTKWMRTDDLVRLFVEGEQLMFAEVVGALSVSIAIILEILNSLNKQRGGDRVISCDMVRTNRLEQTWL